MNHLREGLTWLNDPTHWTARGGLLDRLQEHLELSLWAVLLGCAIGWPLGIWLGRRGRGGSVAGRTVGLPALALLAIVPLTPLGLGRPAVVVALAIVAVPPLLTSASTGVRRIDPETREAARGLGLSGGQVLRRIELPLTLPYLTAGFRTAAVQVVATAALAALVGGGGLGELIAAGFGLGLSTGGGGQIVAGGIAVALLALSVEATLALLQRFVRTRRPIRGFFLSGSR